MTIDPLLKEYLDKRRVRDAAQEDLDAISEILIKQMETDQRKSYRWEKGTVIYKQTRTAVIDEKGLRKALTAKVFDKYTVRKLDRTAMERAMDSGEVDPITVSRFVSIKPGKTYLELREKEITE